MPPFVGLRVKINAVLDVKFSPVEFETIDLDLSVFLFPFATQSSCFLCYQIS